MEEGAVEGTFVFVKEVFPWGKGEGWLTHLGNEQSVMVVDLEDLNWGRLSCQERVDLLLPSLAKFWFMHQSHLRPALTVYPYQPLAENASTLAMRLIQEEMTSSNFWGCPETFDDQPP